VAAGVPASVGLPALLLAGPAEGAMSAGAVIICPNAKGWAWMPKPRACTTAKILIMFILLLILFVKILIFSKYKQLAKFAIYSTYSTE
jgi:hypothetical protein